MTGVGNERQFPIEVTCSPSENVNKSIVLLFSPKQSSLFSNILWLTVSNALLRSRNTAPVTKPLSMLGSNFILGLNFGSLKFVLGYGNYDN